MRKFKHVGEMFTLIFLIFVLFAGCSSNKPKEPTKEAEPPKDGEYINVTDPNGTVMTINDMPVTKAELEAEVAKLKPPENYGLMRALQNHFLLETTVQKHFKEQIDKVMVDAKDIASKIKSGELTFEDAMSKYSEDKQQKGDWKDYSPGSSFYSFDKAVFALKEGDISEPIVTPFGVNIVKLNKINKDLNGEVVSADLSVIMLSFNKYMPEGEDVNSKMMEYVYKSEIKILDDSLAKEVPDFYTFGIQDQEQIKKKQEELAKKPEPATKWRDLPAETVVVKINGTDVTVGQLKEIEAASMPSKREMYNMVIQRVFIPSLGMIGHFKANHEEIKTKLNDIKKKIEAGEMTFEEAQKEYSTDPGKEQGYVYKDIKKGQFVPEFEKVMFSIPLNKISDPFLTQFGGHILMVEKETKNDAGEREVVDVRHILIGFDQYVDKENPNAMYQVRMQVQQETKIKVIDSYLHSLLPGLEKINEPKPADAAAGEAGTETEPGAESAEGATPESTEKGETPGNTEKPEEPAKGEGGK